MNRATVVVALLVVLHAPGFARAEPPAPLADRAAILRVEMNRGPAEALAPFLEIDTPPRTRRLAIRALGRIGDRGEAPEMLARLIETMDEELPLVLWAAGIARTERLAAAISEHVVSDDPLVAAAAVEAMGWTGAKGAVEDLALMLPHASPEVRAAALRGYARLRPPDALETLIPFLDAKDPGERASAEFAVWRIATERGRIAREKDPKWAGDAVLDAALRKRLAGADSERKLMLLRALAPVIHDAPPFELLRDPDARVVQEFIRLVPTKWKDEAATAALARAVENDDASVRELAARALGERGAAAPLRARFAKEKDLRIRDILAVELARCRDETAWDSIRDDPAREEIEEVTRLLTRAEVLLASPREGAIAELTRWMTPTEAGGLPPAVVVSVLWDLAPREDASIWPWLDDLVNSPYASRDPHVVASAVVMMIENRLCRVEKVGEATRLAGILPRTLERLAPADAEVRRGIAGAWGAVADDPPCPVMLRALAEASLRSSMSANEPSAWVRLAALESARTLGLGDLPDADSLPANDWKGLPRPAKPVLGLDLSGEGDWLSEAEILRLADRIEELGTRIDIVTTAGTMRLALMPEHAPVHCASLVLSAARGLYRNTRWHRVVPSFVIQGGDPHGHGAGDGGWTVPDEIGPMSYDRGILGMPKSRKDDGGCQLFVMHSPSPRLDGLYTAYGRVVDGIETVDRIRVGDRILDVNTVP